MRLDQSRFFEPLQQQAARLKQVRLTELFAQDPQRVARYSLQAPGLFIDYSKNFIDIPSLQVLLALAHEQGLENAIADLFGGVHVNNTEDRPALHTALRQTDATPVWVDGVDVMPEVHATRQKMAQLVNRIHDQTCLGFNGKPIDTLVSIGIGGSYLGPKTALEALTPYVKKGLKCHFVANIDGSDITEVLHQINAETTLFLLQTKSFSTLETLENARYARTWMLQQGMPESAAAQHFYAVTSNVPAALAFGIPEANTFPMWDWVGGRYSLWSAIGLPIAFGVGMAHFNAMLAGAEAMDQHFRNAPLAQNAPVLLGLLGCWYVNFFGAETQAVLPYDHYLTSFTNHLQQLDMESSGKHVDRHGEALTYHSGPVIWGGVGSNGQHAYHQLLHQGTRLIPADFIIALKTQNPVAQHHDHLFSNCLSQAQALMQGKSEADACSELITKGMPAADAKSLAKHKAIEGNKPSTLLVFDELNPAALGALIALYEHRVFVQSVIWNIDPFDQWGVELGKVLSGGIFKQLQNGAEPDQKLDASTASLIERFRQANQRV